MIGEIHNNDFSSGSMQLSLGYNKGLLHGFYLSLLHPSFNGLLRYLEEAYDFSNQSSCGKIKDGGVYFIFSKIWCHLFC